MAKPYNYKFRGIPKIQIPKTDNDFLPTNKYGLDIIKKYLPTILQQHKQSREKINYLHDFMLGLQDIANKKRLYNKDVKNNNKVSENHAYRHVNFKVAFTTSERRTYSHKGDVKCDDMIFLDRYFDDVDFFAKDKNVKEWIYTCGVGVTYHCPRTDIIEKKKKNGIEYYSYKTKQDGFDIETEAPFEFNDVDPRDNFVVYSSVRGNNPLFCVSLVKTEKQSLVDVPITGDNYEYKIYIETRYARFVARCGYSFDGFDNLAFEVGKSFFDMPMVEHCVNSARMGVVELNRDLFNCINTLVSNVIDMIVDGANIILVFKNTDISQKIIDDMKSKGALVLNDNPENKNNSEAKLDVITIKIDFAGLNSFYEERLTQAYDIAGVPLASGQVTSGGDTGQARLLGGGWENAHTIIRNDITTLLKGDNDVLKGILKICKEIPSCPVKNIAASQIQIKYRINQSDNMLVKAQSIAQLYGVNMPKEEILKATNLFDDVCALAKKWEQQDQKARETKAKQEIKKQDVADKDDGDTTGGDNNVGAKNDGKDKNVPTKDKQDNSSQE